MKQAIFILTLILLAGCAQKNAEEEAEEGNSFHRMAELEAQKSDRAIR